MLRWEKVNSELGGVFKRFYDLNVIRVIGLWVNGLWTGFGRSGLYFWVG